MIEFISNHSLMELTSTIMIIIGTIILMLFLIFSSKGSTLKLIGILFVIGLSLFSNNDANYFLSILVIATLVTDLEFLQNIAAIIRNSDSYFKFMETQTISEIEDNLAIENFEIERAFQTEEPTEVAAEEPTEEVAEEPTEEVAEEPTVEVAEEPTDEAAEEPTVEVDEEPTEEVAEETTEEPREEQSKEEESKISTEDFSISKASKGAGKNTKNYINNSNLSSVQFGFMVEEFVFKYLERKYDCSINRYARVGTSSVNKIEVDGIISLRNRDVFVEVKTSKRGYVPINYIRKALDKYIIYLNQVNSKKSKAIELKLVLVGQYSDNQTLKISKLVNEYRRNLDYDISIDILSIEEIGLDKSLLEIN